MLAVGDGSIYAAVVDGKLYALNAATGAIRWSASLEVTNSSPLLANGVVYVIDGDGTLVAFDAATGRRLWSKYVAPFAPIDPASPTVVNGAVIVGGEDGLTSFRVPAG